MHENPFAPHAPAASPVFVDRDRELDLIFSHFLSRQRGNVAISGPLGIGKTSLLRYASDPQVARQHGIEPPAYVSLCVDVHAVAPFTAARFWRRIGQLLARTADGSLAEAVAPLQSETVDIVDLEELLDGLAARGTTLLLLLDEFEWVLEAEDGIAECRNFLAQLASLARRTPRALCLVVATQQPLSEVMRAVASWRGSPFATIFSTIELKPLEQVDCERLFHLALGEQEDLLTDADHHHFFALTGGQPAVVQAVAFALHHARTQGKGPDELRAAAAAAASRALATLRPTSPSGAKAAEPEPETPESGLRLDPLSGDVFVDGQRVEGLTALEYNLLRLLYAQPGRLHTKEDLIRHVWGPEFVGHVDHSRVEKLMSRLRQKVEPVAGRPRYLRTVRGRGYRYAP